MDFKTRTRTKISDGAISKLPPKKSVRISKKNEATMLYKDLMKIYGAAIRQSLSRERHYKKNHSNASKSHFILLT